MKRDGIAVARNALGNVSRDPVSEAELQRMLATGDGPSHLVRALFEDCSGDTLERLAITFGLTPTALRAAYAHAKARHAVINPDLEHS